jgi:hypothetical protein
MRWKHKKLRIHRNRLIYWNIQRTCYGPSTWTTFAEGPSIAKQDLDMPRYGFWMIFKGPQIFMVAALVRRLAFRYNTSSNWIEILVACNRGMWILYDNLFTRISTWCAQFLSISLGKLRTPWTSCFATTAPQFGNLEYGVLNSDFSTECCGFMHPLNLFSVTRSQRR